MYLLHNELRHFPSCSIIKAEISDACFIEFSEECKFLLDQFNSRFKDFEQLRSFKQIFYTPLTCNIAEQLTEYQLELTDLQCDSVLTTSGKSGIEFWKLVSQEKYASLHNAVSKLVSAFASTYICEQTFSTLKFIKNDHRSRLSDDNLENLIRVALNKSEIDFDSDSVPQKYKYCVVF